MLNDHHCGAQPYTVSKGRFEAGSLVLKGMVVNGWNGVEGDMHENIHL
ncbi:hypothetical protein [Sulfuracidifex metallicus]|nr:hypothetical protein [Sulfuracidifex metallicus]